MAPSPDLPGHIRGYIMPIGGAEEREGSPQILAHFIELSGGRSARIVIIPTASELPDTGNKYQDIFTEIGVASVESLPISERIEGSHEDYLDSIDNATGIFITGGNQLRLSTILGGTDMARRIRRLNAEGVCVAGTSAGAAIMPEHMIAGGPTGVVPSRGGVQLAPGLGLTNSLLIDQHFSQRERLGRLLTAISYNPFLLGIGIDEDTAIVINAEQEFEVIGSGAVTVIDPSELSYTSMSAAGRNETLSLLDLRMHILASGCRFRIDQRKPFAPDAD